jgi:alpha-beta hydrolase superfamily lysophospholipase
MSITTTPAPLPATDRTEEARKLIMQMAEGEFETAVESFDDTMRNALPAEKLKEVWGQLTTQLGTYVSQGEARTTSEDNYDIVVITTQFEKGLVDARVVFDDEGRVAGLFFGPSTSGPQPTFATPAYADTSAFTEREVTIGEGEWVLTGTLTLPNGDGPFPGVVLVQGSGPHDRDETIGPNKPFRDLAWGLASRGIAVLRYDKRTHTHSQKMASIADKVTVKEEVVDDAAAAVEVLRSAEGVDPKKVYLLGHSLGGYLAPMIGQQSPNLAGLVILAGSTRPMEDLLVEQLTYIAGLDGSVSPDEQKELDKVKEQVARLKDPSLSPNTPADQLPLGAPAAYWLSLRDYKPGEMANELDKPVLVLQGERDYQVTMEDFEGWKEALSSKNATLKSYPDLNHLFMEGTGKATPQEYEKAGHVDEEVVDDIATWLKER